MDIQDRELLELAAKAAGIQVRWTDKDIYQGSFLRRVVPAPEAPCSEWLYWRPLDDDGDALRLAVALKLNIKFLDGFKQVCCFREVDRERFEMHGLVGYGEGADPWVSAENVRRAIVRAAAEIGRSMP